ncbi:hypothetical protein F4803DRAFT_499038 [Xylaria telfairii]|nr:hypothetical protein F4803DRAFT_499038 [Xylaria telfairii]
MPLFVANNQIIIVRINSKAQVHPLMAARWSAVLGINEYRILLVVNEGYLQDKVCFVLRRSKRPD